ncbi:Uncharacterised protein [Legionella steigerwaltii]|uniref:Uncharacterized protein n=1 Tax=Legionella steigerwaltii TaxID=460 RepID=A0A378LCN3_9GAMM|nr:hypothetical protein [Legionella steigerwaltii]KTD78522.1 hypothetical protein Lstg_1257 [Legionella steigerwaltii]STY24120.1 Uncharacterised protein [Legionella steigerwaltii]
MWKQGLGIFKKGTSIEQFFKLDSNMWAFESHKHKVCLPISFGGSLITEENVIRKLGTLAQSKCYARTMSLNEFAHSPPLIIAGTSTKKIPSGLCGLSQLVKYSPDGSVDIEKSVRAFMGHHKQTGKDFEGSALSFSHQWTLYHFLALISGKSSVVLADSTGLPNDHEYTHGADDEVVKYDPSGIPEVHTYEHEVTLQDVPLISIPGRFHRQGFKLTFSANPYFIDLQNKLLPEEVRGLAQQAIQGYMIANAIRRTGREVPGRPYITLEQANQMQKKAISANIEVMIEVEAMSTEQQNLYFEILYSLRGQKKPVHHTHIEVEEQEKEQGLETQSKSTPRIEEITDEEARELQEKERDVEEDDTGLKKR